MSLLNDALKRAKLEALEREAEHRGGFELPTGRESRSPRRARAAVWVGGLLVLVLAGGALGWLLARARSAEPSVAVGGGVMPAEAAEPEASPQPAAVGTETISGAAPGGESQSEPVRVQVADDTASAEPGPNSDVQREESPQFSRAPAKVKDPRSEDAGRGHDPSVTDGATYVRVLQTDGERLELQGIAYRRDRAVAIINGLMVSAEDMVGGFLVVAVEPERVQLQGHGATVYLALH